MAWGDRTYGGDVSKAQAQLDLGVEQVWSTRDAFFAKLSNGKGVAWGDPTYGGDASGVQAQLDLGVE